MIDGIPEIKDLKEIALEHKMKPITDAILECAKYGYNKIIITDCVDNWRLRRNEHLILIIKNELIVSKLQALGYKIEKRERSDYYINYSYEYIEVDVPIILGLFTKKEKQRNTVKQKQEVMVTDYIISWDYE